MSETREERRFTVRRGLLALGTTGAALAVLAFLIPAPGGGPRRRPPNSETRNGAPDIVARARDAETDLRASDLSLFVDGREAANFACDRGEDRLKYTPRSLQRGRHTVRVEATDARGLGDLELPGGRTTPGAGLTEVLPDCNNGRRGYW